MTDAELDALVERLEAEAIRPMQEAAQAIKELREKLHELTLVRARA